MEVLHITMFDSNGTKTTEVVSQFFLTGKSM